jgi:hypothetical protein
MRRILAITAFVLAAGATAHADVYRYIDAQGRPQYSDRWVPGSTLVKTDRNRPSADAAAQRAADQSKLAASNERISAQLNQQAAARAVKADLEKARSEQCKQATERYEKSIQARRMYKAGKDGEREYLTDQQADEARLAARMERDQACGTPAK